MALHTLRLATPELEADLGFFQVLGYALCELEEPRARLIPGSGPELHLEHAGGQPQLVPVLGGLGPREDLEGNPLAYAPPPRAATSRGQAIVLGPVLPVVDLPSSLAWYERHLGLRERFSEADTGWSELEHPEGGRFVLAFAPELDTPAMLALAVRDAAAEVERLGEYDFLPVWTRSVPWGRMAAYAAPGGLPVLLVEASSSSG
ncbi:MAG TPA: VOC family protein [Oceanithermus profundus]|uniref:VOC family protein n=1 Tax=Oceanithermus profundus TaxID=187137 RepID=A0A7C4VIZ2_9DEIN|nr:VOC family protein [Oceanithermus profundus]